jgi:hypothetical protein
MDAEVVDPVMRRITVDTTASLARPNAEGMPHGDEWATILARRVARSNERARSRLTLPRTGN